MRVELFVPFVVIVAIVAIVAVGCEAYPSRARIPFELSADVGGLTRVEVETRNGAITVACRDGVEQASIRGAKFARGVSDDDAREHAEKIDVTVERVEDGDTLRIAAVIPEALRRRSPGVDFEIVLPPEIDLGARTSNGRVTAEGTRGSVTIESSNGAVNVASIDGSVNARSSNGKIEVKAVTGDLDLRTSNGAIRIDGGGREKVKAVTSNGKIVAHGVKGNAHLRSSNGPIELVAVALPETPEIDIATSNGKISVDLPATVRAVLEMETSNGSLSTDFHGTSAELIESDKRRLHARLNGGGGSIRIQSRNGSVSYRSVR